MEEVLMVPELMFGIFHAVVLLPNLEEAIRTLSAASQVCWQWKQCSEDRFIWREICRRRWIKWGYPFSQYEADSHKGSLTNNTRNNKEQNDETYEEVSMWSIPLADIPFSSNEYRIDWRKHFVEVMRLLEEFRFAICLLDDTEKMREKALSQRPRQAHVQDQFLQELILTFLRQYNLYKKRVQLARHGRKKRTSKKKTIVVMDNIPPILFDALIAEIRMRRDLSSVSLPYDPYAPLRSMEKFCYVEYVLEADAAELLRWLKRAKAKKNTTAGEELLGAVLRLIVEEYPTDGKDVKSLKDSDWGQAKENNNNSKLSIEEARALLYRSVAFSDGAIRLLGCTHDSPILY